ncbi:baseplate J/gp47 family protein [Luteibacter yeojuensis]|uniref:baseplate J/gp47 family protein n=1 Tax=Luteibacter yeojuensis TaxID=345309 RepID=UPI0009FE4F1C|nr:baseplate J/gp47 family protein [Luteibacter yeojuensis]
MPIQTPTFESLRARYLRDLRNEENDTSTDSDNAVRAASVAAVAEGLYAEIQWLYRQIWATDADADELERHARDRGLTRKPAIASIGTCRVTGRPAARLPEGAAIRHPAGTTFTTMADAVVGPDGTTKVRVVAVDAGSSTNGLAGPATVISPPAGLDSDALLVEALAGGSDEESSLALLNRYLDVIRRPPAGGNQYDYRRWAKDVPGVADAWVYPLRSGLGTVDVAIVAEDGLPTPELVQAVQFAIDRNRPAGGRAGQVFSPKELLVDVVAKVDIADGYTLEGLVTSGHPLVAALIDRIAPGEPLRRSLIEGVLTNLPGVNDRHLVSPATNVKPGSGQGEASLEWIRLGRFVLEPME